MAHRKLAPLEIQNLVVRAFESDPSGAARDLTKVHGGLPGRDDNIDVYFNIVRYYTGIEARKENK